MSGPLRVGLNLAYLVEDSGGSGRYARELIPALMRLEPGIEITAWVGSTAPEDLREEPWAPELRWVRLPVPGIGTPWHLWHELVGIGLAARRRRLDVVHGLANLVPVLTPGLASVVTILDVIWMHHPEAMGARARVAMRTLAPLCGRSADRVIAISDAAAQDISTTLKIQLAKFDVTPLGITPPALTAPVPSVPADSGEGAQSVPGESTVRERLGLRHGPLVLCVAAKRAHKNLDGLIRALARLPRPRPLLVLPGSPSPYEDELRRLAAELGVEEDVAFPAWIDERDLQALYAQAACFVLPSFQEGFGLPVLEAMARGVPVACSNTSSLPEVAGDAALLFDPHDETAIASQIQRLLTDRALAEELAVRGLARAELFTWRRTAELTLESYRRALGTEPTAHRGSRGGVAGT
jgi:glycosyltransferase involved in cell wall biosynthesis